MNSSTVTYERLPNSNEYTPQVGPIAALDEEALILSVADYVTTSVPYPNTKEWLGVRVGTIGLLVPVTAGRELLNPPPTARLPHTPPWLAGLTNVRGSLVPVVDTACALELARNAAARQYLLIFDHGNEALGLIVDGLPRRQGFEAGECLNGIPPHPQLLLGHITAAYGKESQLWLELDIESFFGALAQALAPT